MKRIKIGLLLAMLSLLLIACGGAEPPVVEEAAPTAEQSAEEEPTEEPAEEPTEEPAEEPTEEPAEEPAEEPTEEPAEEEPAEEDAMAEEGPVTIGMMKIVSHPALDAIQASFLETLAEGGYVEGENLTIIDGNAEGDIATLTTIAQQFVDEEVDLIATTSTPALQAAYNVTKDMENPIPIIFNAVTSPYAAGIATAPDDHPAWVLGTQIFPPIPATFEVMQEAFPDAQVIGYLYNPAEANSVTQFEETEPIAEELGYTLEIGTISNSSEIKTAAEALVARGIDFFYYGQDSTIASGVEGLVQVANENAIPIITNDMPGVGRGVALGVGLDFSEDGKMSGQYAVEFLDGELDLATAEIVRVETTEYHYNTEAAELQGLTIPQAILDNGLDKTPGAEESAAEEEPAEEEPAEEEPAEEEAMAEKGPITIGMMKIVSHPALDAIQASFLETLAEGGYVEGENLTIIDGNAEGDIATLTTIAQQFVDEEVDLIATTSTPALQAAYNVTKDMEPPIPIIFNAVTSPYAAGIATAPDDHPAWLLGTQIFPPIAATFDVMQETFPDAYTIGYLYNPAEANSVTQFEETEPIAEELGYTLEIGTITNSSEIKTAAEALVARGIDFFYYGQDSTIASGVEGLVQVANENAIPIITNDMPGVGRGVALGVGLDFSEDGILSGQYAVEFLDGELDLATAEILRVETTEYHYNTAAAELQGVTIPQSILDNGLDKTPGAEEEASEEEASEEEASEEEASEEEPAEEEAMAEKGPITIGMMKIVSHPALDTIQASFLETLAEGGYVEGENLTIIDGNAEGDIATLTTIAQQFVDEEVDLIATTSTPALQAAYNVTKDMENPIPIIFNAVTSPYAAGIATAPDDHPAWLLGTQIFPPIAATFDVMQEAFPDAQVIGYLYNPAEANSVAQFEETEPIAEELGYTLEIGTISNSSEIKTAAEALVARGIDFFYYSQDSTMASGAEGLIQVANDNAIPIITNDMPGVGRGVAIGVGLDFSEDGKLSGQYAVEFLDGELDLATAEIVRVETTEYHYNTEAAELQGLTIPQSILDEGLDKTP